LDKKETIKKVAINVITGVSLGYLISAEGKFLNIYDHEVLNISKGNSPLASPHTLNASGD